MGGGSQEHGRHPLLRPLTGTTTTFPLASKAWLFAFLTVCLASGGREETAFPATGTSCPPHCASQTWVGDGIGPANFPYALRKTAPKEGLGGAEKMVQGLGALLALAEDPCSISSIHTMAHSHL